MRPSTNQVDTLEGERALTVPSDGKFRACSSCLSGLRRDVLESAALAQLRGLQG